MRTNWIAAMVAGTALLAGPATTFAATAEKAATTDVTEEELMEVLDSATSMPIMRDGMGGGGIYNPYMGGVQVDASITKEVTPDFVAVNAYCDIGKRSTREEARTAADQVYKDIKAAVGTDGRVRKSGGVSVYPFYNPTGEESGSYTGNVNIFIRLVNASAAGRIADVIENKGCSVNWDVRLVDMQDFEMSVLDDLSDRLNKRKAVFEKLLGKKLNTIINASLNTWVDGYSSYDPETNKADATTTLSVTFDIGSKAAVSTPSTGATRVRTPRG